MVRVISIFLSLALVTVTTCSTYARPVPLAAFAPALSKGDKTTPPQYETRVYLRRKCLITESTDAEAPQEFLAAIAAIFVPLLIQKALGGIAGALKKAGAEETLRDTVTFPTYLYQISDTSGTRTLSLNPNFGCLIVVRGTFKGMDPADQSVVNFSGSPGQTLFGQSQKILRRTRLNDSNIPVDEIAFLYEAQITTSNEGVALYYQSRFLEVHAFQGSRSSNVRGLVLGVALNGAGPKDGEPTLSLALMNLGEVQKDAVLGPSQLFSRRSGWLGGVGLTEDALAAIEKTKLKPNETKGVMPISVQATLAETENGNKALRFIGDLLDSTKEDVSKAISSEILDKDKRVTAANEAREKLRQEEEAAYADFLKALTEQEAAGLPGTPLSSIPPSATAAQRAKIFEVERTQRIWCAKYKALKSIGETTSGTRMSCP